MLQEIEIGSTVVTTPKEYLDVFFPQLSDGTYRAVCLNNGFIGERCRNNLDSLCVMILLERPRDFYHYWDGKNAWKCPCG
jgi:hypothetical protein